MAVEYQLGREGSKQAEAGGHANCFYFVQRLVVKTTLKCLIWILYQRMVQNVDYALVSDCELCKIYSIFPDINWGTQYQSHQLQRCYVL